MTLIKVENLSKSFGGITAINGLDLSIESGGIVSIIGPNGAGKTTLFNLLTGVYAPTAGHISIEGVDVTGQSSHQLAAAGLSRTFQNVQSFMNMSALENVMVGGQIRRSVNLISSLLKMPSARREERQIIAKATESLEFVGLGDQIRTDAENLPYGQKRLMEIARALATEPKLILLDEPSAGMSYQRE